MLLDFFLKKAIKGGTQQVIAGPNALAHFFFFLRFVKKIKFSWSSDDYHGKEQRFAYRIGK